MIEIKKVTKQSADALFKLIMEMAAHEKETDQVVNTPEKIRKNLVEDEQAQAYLIYVDGNLAGYFIYFYTYSSYLGRRNLYIEDIFIRPEKRGSGLGKQVLSHICAVAKREGCARVDWTCLDWNTNAMEFYHHMGADFLKERCYFRMEKEQINRLAGEKQ